MLADVHQLRKSRAFEFEPVYRITYRGPVVDALQDLIDTATARGCTVQRYMTNSKYHGHLERLAYAVIPPGAEVPTYYDHPTNTSASRITGAITWNMGTNLEGKTARCEAYKAFVWMKKRIEALYPVV